MASTSCEEYVLSEVDIGTIGDEIEMESKNYLAMEEDITASNIGLSCCRSTKDPLYW